MKRSASLVSLLSLLATLVATPLAAQSPGEPTAVYPSDCDRNCLIGHLRGYLRALSSRNPARLPLAADVRFSENEVLIPVGEGLWGTVSEVASAGLEVADPQSGHAAWFGTVKENGEPAYFAFRLRVVKGRITEIQSIVHRKTGLPAPFGNPDVIVHDPEFNEVLPPAERRSRERLIAVAQSYFNTVEVNDGMVFAPFHEDCARLENGISTTSARGGGGAANIAAGCEAQFKLGMYRINKRVRERLYPLVDVERGIVVASGYFDHSNTFDRYLLTNGREMRTALKWPNSIALLEAFRVKEGRIHRIETVFTYVPYFKHSPWAGESGDFATQAAPVSAAAGRPDCDRNCLSALAQQYMAALPTKEYAALPWAETVGFSENGVPMMIGDGVWGTVTAVGEKPLIVTDPANGNVAWVGTIAEHGQLSFYAMRLRAVGGRIAEIETVVRRQQGNPPFGDPLTFAHDPSFTNPVPQAQRSARERLVGLVEGYFNGLEANDGTLLTRFAADCRRHQNGVLVSHGKEGRAALAQGCEAQVKAGLFREIDAVRGLRVPVVDEERGIAVAFGHRDLSARNQVFTTTTGKAFAGTTKYPHSYDFATVFRIEDGKIRRIEDYTNETTYRMTSAWRGQ